MPDNPVYPVPSRSRVPRGLTLALFVLSLYAAVALAAGGVARADEGQDGAGAAGASTSQSESAGSATDAPSGAPSGTSGAAAESESKKDSPRDRSPRDASDPDTTGKESTDEPKRTDTPQQSDTTNDTTNDATEDTVVGADAAADPPAADPPAAVDPPSESAPPTPANETLSAPDELDLAPVLPLPPVDVAGGGSDRTGQLATVTALATRAESNPQSTAGPSARTASPAGTAPTPAALVAVTPSDAPPATQRDLGPPLAGLIADVGTVAVSAVHSAATAVALFFGPDTFLGIPALLATLVANTAAAVGRSIVGAPFIEPTGRFAVTYGILDGLAFFNPTKPPAGANDPTIDVTAEHPLPIILLNGTTATQGTNWSVGAPVLANAGYKVYTFNYGNNFVGANTPIQATADINQSGMELAAEVQRVLLETGAEKVILIGHSQGGGILPVHYINNLGGAQYVSQLIGIAPSNHGTDFNGLIFLQTLPIFGPLALAFADQIGLALRQQTVDSPFQQVVYGEGDTRPGVLYTNIISVNDEVVTPFTQQALDGPEVTNIVLQERYPGAVIGHANIIVSPQAWETVLDALASNPAANPLHHQESIAA